MVSIGVSKVFFIVVYLDDGWGTASSFEECQNIATNVKNDLLSGGLIPNREKSVWNPVQELNWLGMVWNSSDGTIKAMNHRIDSILTSLEELITSLPNITARKLSVLVGKVISLLPIIGHIAQLHTSFPSIFIAQQYNWDKLCKLSSNSLVIEEIFFWKRNVKDINMCHVFEYELPQVLVYTDSSGTGCGAVTYTFQGDAGKGLENMKFTNTWSQFERGKSSTWREMKGVEQAIRAFVPKLKGKCVKIFTDNKGVESGLKKGSMNVELHQLILDINLFCKNMGISLQVPWIPREDNAEADVLSREIDLDDCGVSQDFFND